MCEAGVVGKGHEGRELGGVGREAGEDLYEVGATVGEEWD